MKLIQILVLATVMAPLVRAQNTAPAPQNGTQPQPKSATGNAKKAAAASDSTAGKKTVAPVNGAKQSSKTDSKSGVTSKNAAGANAANNGQTKTAGGTKSPGTSAKAPAAVAGAKSAQTNTAKKSAGTAGKGSTAPQITKTQASKNKTQASTKKGTAAKKETQPKAARATKGGASAASGAPGSAPTQLAGAHGRRDPFLSPIHHVETGGPTPPPCSSGKRCLAIPEIILQGTVKDTTGKMMALVATGSHTYMLRENDQVFNGSVIKITSDSVTFREYTTDKFGKEVAHEVVKRLTPTS